MQKNDNMEEEGRRGKKREKEEEEVEEEEKGNSRDEPKLMNKIFDLILR